MVLIQLIVNQPIRNVNPLKFTDDNNSVKT